MKLSGQTLIKAAPIITGVGLFVVYAITAPPGLSWDLGGADGGDLAAGVLTRGLVHPPGYPTYLLAAQIPILFPIGTPAHRLNLFSAACMAIMCGIVSWMVNRTLLSEKHTPITAAAGGLAGLLLGLTPIVWSQAIITEVYALAGLVCASMIRLAYWAAQGKDDQLSRRLAVVGLVGGVGMGAHYIVGLAILFVLVYFAVGMPGRFFRLPILAWLGGLLAGLLVFAYLPLRAGAVPLSDWGRPDSLDRLWWVVSGAAYAGRWQVEILPGRLASLIRVIVEQLSVPGIALAVLGLSVWWDARPRLLIAGLVALAANLIMVAGYESADTLPYLLPTLILLALASGTASYTLIGTWLPAALKARPWRMAVVGVALVIITLVPVLVVSVPHISTAKASAEEYGRLIIESAPPGSVIVSNNDKQTFAIRYAIASNPARADLIPVDSRLLQFDWFRQDLSQHYPTLKLPPDIRSEEPTYSIGDLLLVIPPEVPVIFTYPTPLPFGFTLSADEGGYIFWLVRGDNSP